MCTHNEMPVMELRGRCHPPPSKDPRYKGWSIWASEVSRVMPKYVGKPVYVEHDENKVVVGKVKTVFKDKISGSLVVDLTINNDNAGWDAMKAVQTGVLGDLSLGYEAWGIEETGARDSEAVPQEISLCRKGAMDDAKIFGIKIDGIASISSELGKSVYTSTPFTILNSHNPPTKMSASTEDARAPATTSAPVVPDVTDPEIARLIALGKQTEKRNAEIEKRRIDELRDLLLNNISPGWKKIVLNNPADEIPELGHAIEKIMESDDPSGRVLLQATAKWEGSYRGLEEKYLASQAKIKAMEEEALKREASKVGLGSAEERKVTGDFSGIASMFSAGITNSSSSSSTSSSGGEQAGKRGRYADMFVGMSDTPAMMNTVRNDLTSGKYRMYDSSSAV